jgi:hypothetical protein
LVKLAAFTRQDDSPMLGGISGECRFAIISSVPDLVFKDLFAYGKGSLGWARVYRTDSEHAIALVLNPTDSPGSSAVNAAEQLLGAIGRAFAGMGELRVFGRFPDDPRGDGWTELLNGAGGVDFERHGREEVEGLLGVDLDELEPEDASCAGLGGASHPLLALIPPPEEEVDPLARMAVIAVADLPWAHNPSYCHWKSRFADLEGLYPPSRDDRPALGAHWFLTLTDTDLAACSYHQADWKRVAAVAVEVFESLSQDATIEDVPEAVADLLGGSPEAEWCTSLFTDPIVWDPGNPSITNGQHRTCALKASNAPYCVVDVYGAFVDEPVAAEPRRRAAAEVSAFWVRQAAR